VTVLAEGSRYGERVPVVLVVTVANRWGQRRVPREGRPLELERLDPILVLEQLPAWAAELLAAEAPCPTV
jgi:hypothetical protein